MVLICCYPFVNFVTPRKGLLMSFRCQKRRTETMLSECIWDIQQQQLNYVVNWKIIEKTSGFNPITLQCKICLSEIYHIVVNPIQASLNQRLETF